MNDFQKRLEEGGLALRKRGIEVLQVNLGRRCNQLCVHCHVNAGPARKEENMGRDYVAGFLKGGKLASLDERMAEHGFRVILCLRLIPVIPFKGVNFGAGLSQVKYRHYLLGSLLGMLPATFIYTYSADALLSGATGASREALVNLGIAGLLLMALSFVPVVYRRLRVPERFREADQACPPRPHFPD